ncbi:interactor of constitutive active ROPs 2, chloroplastic-like protein [Tanacetum coccineum]
MNSLSLELEKSNARADSLEGLVSKLEAKDVNPKGNDDVVVDDQEELNCVKIEVEKLCSQFVGAEKRYQSTLQIRSAYELVEQTRSESEAAQREALMKVGYLTEEADKSSRKVVRVSEQLDLAQAVSHTLEIC